MVYQIIAILIGLYLVSESISAAALMPRGDNACRVVKHLLTGVAGMCLIAMSHLADGLHLLMAFTLCLFFWPKMAARIDHIFDKLIGE